MQETLLQTFRRIEGFEYRGEGALQAYLRQAVMNRIRDELRKAEHRPEWTELDPELPDAEASPLESAIGSDAIDRYESALNRLRPEERELVIARVEMGLTYSEIASASGKCTANAARMAVARALMRLAEEMGETGPAD